MKVHSSYSTSSLSVTDDGIHVDGYVIEESKDRVLHSGLIAVYESVADMIATDEDTTDKRDILPGSVIVIAPKALFDEIFRTDTLPGYDMILALARDQGSSHALVDTLLDNEISLSTLAVISL
jgi:hypothetical protein